MMKINVNGEKFFFYEHLKFLKKLTIDSGVTEITFKILPFLKMKYSKFVILISFFLCIYDMKMKLIIESYCIRHSQIHIYIYICIKKYTS